MDLLLHSLVDHLPWDALTDRDLHDLDEFLALDDLVLQKALLIGDPVPAGIKPRIWEMARTAVNRRGRG